jgi:hypothetical protein
MAEDEAVATWTEHTDGVVVQFPAPPGGENAGCAWVLLIIAFLFAIFLPAFVVLMLMEKLQLGLVGIALLMAAELVILRLSWGFLKEVRYSQHAPPQPSILTICSGVLKIERAGPDGELNVSWELKEIADIRLCATADVGRILLGLLSPLIMLFNMPRGPLVRISVMLPTGAVEDTVVLAPVGRWVEDVEQRLRHYLGLAKEITTMNCAKEHE